MTNGEQRQRLAAILAADASGFSRLMERDEHATLAALEAARAVFRQEVESNQGSVIDTAGDSVLAVFDTAAGAVTAALAHSARARAHRPAMSRTSDACDSASACTWAT